jgi:hypothetical protein
LDADPPTSVHGFPQALDVANELHLGRRLPARPDSKLAPESSVVDRLVAENASPNIVPEDLRRSCSTSRA